MSDKMMSLFDYLGRAAGPKLGWEVAKEANLQKTKTGIREVSNTRYSGPIKLYTENFLMSFFNNPKYRTTIKEDEIWYEEKKKSKEIKKDNNLPF